VAEAEKDSKINALLVCTTNICGNFPPKQICRILFSLLIYSFAKHVQMSIQAKKNDHSVI